MPVIETVSIINKSGKLISTSKHLVNIFKDARDAYQEKKAELRADSLQKEQDRLARKLQDVHLEELQSVHSSSSKRSQRTRRSKGHKSNHRTKYSSKLPALKEQNLTQIEEGSIISSRHTSHHGDQTSPRSSSQIQAPAVYHPPYVGNTATSQPTLVRSRTEDQNEGANHLARSNIPPTLRSLSTDDIDMNLAYGELPPPSPNPEEKEVQLKTLISRIQKLIIEAQCVQHSTTTIIVSLQQNPEAMAAVALTLAEISNIIAKMSPGILTALKASAPAVFALLASPQFLIAGGVAVGVTIVMFGGFKIIKKIQQDMADKKTAERVEEPMVFNGDLSVIDTWRRGIAEAEAQSIGTSVDGEFITPEAARARNQRIRERAKEERRDLIDHEDSTIWSTTRPVRPSEVSVRSSSKSVVSGSKNRERTGKTESRDKYRKQIKDKKAKKPSALSVLFKKGTLRKPVESYKPVLATI